MDHSGQVWALRSCASLTGAIPRGAEAVATLGDRPLEEERGEGVVEEVPSEVYHGEEADDHGGRGEAYEEGCGCFFDLWESWELCPCQSSFLVMIAVVVLGGGGRSLCGGLVFSMISDVLETARDRAQLRRRIRKAGGLKIS